MARAIEKEQRGKLCRQRNSETSTPIEKKKLIYRKYKIQESPMKQEKQKIISIKQEVKTGFWCCIQMNRSSFFSYTDFTFWSSKRATKRKTEEKKNKMERILKEEIHRERKKNETEQQQEINTSRAYIVAYNHGMSAAYRYTCNSFCVSTISRAETLIPYIFHIYIFIRQNQAAAETIMVKKTKIYCTLSFATCKKNI